MDKIAHLTQHLRHILARPKVAKVEGIAPDRDWKLLLAAAVGVFVVALLYAGYLYREVSKGEIFIQPERSTARLETIDRERLEAAVESFRDRDTRFNELRRSRPTFVDPSL